MEDDLSALSEIAPPVQATEPASAIATTTEVAAQIEAVSITPTPSTAAPTAIQGSQSGEARLAELRKSIEAVVADIPGEWAVGVQDLATGDTLLINAQRQYPAASLYKLLLLYEAYVQMGEGNLRLDQTTTMTAADYAGSLAWDEELVVGDRVTVKGLLRVLVIQSSNAAAHALERLMASSTINGAAQRLGLKDTHMPVPGDSARYNDWRAEEPATSVDDLMSFYGRLYRHELVSAEASEAMLALLKEQQINDRIPALLPPGTKVAHKTGNLPGVVNDAGIVFGPKGDIILVALSQNADHDTGTEAIASIGRLVYNWRNR